MMESSDVDSIRGVHVVNTNVSFHGGNQIPFRNDKTRCVDNDNENDYYDDNDDDDDSDDHDRRSPFQRPSPLLLGRRPAAGGGAAKNR